MHTVKYKYVYDRRLKCNDNVPFDTQCMQKNYIKHSDEYVNNIY